MDKTDKYYNIIKDIITNNKKYEGLEDILDNIIDDVYLHSQAIINSITNDSVILAYLEKVAATSIITVPKKFGYKSNNQRKTSISELDIFEQIKNETNASDNVEKNEKLTDVQLEYVDNMINSANDHNTLNSDDKIVEYNTTNEISNVLNELDDIEELIINDTEEISEDELEIIPAADNNDIADEVSASKGEFENDFDLIENITTNTTENDLPEDIDNLSEILPEEEVLDIQTSSEQSDLNNDEIISDDNHNTISELIESDNDTNLELDSGFDSETSISEVDVNILNDNDLDELVDYDTSESINIDTTLQDSRDETPASNDNSITKTDYSLFLGDNNNNNAISYDIDTIKNKIDQINNINPDLKIYDIYHLKFKDNLNISEIANKLNLSNDIIVDALNQLVDLI